MFCHYCGKETNREACEGCEKTPWNLRGSRRFCLECGLPIGKSERKKRDGTIYIVNTNRKRCKPCLDKLAPPSEKFCEVCDVLLTNGGHKYCPDHKSYRSRKVAATWAKKNPKKCEAARLARYNGHLVKVLYECSHDHHRKHDHHFDYDRVYEVLRLCPTCHSAEHKRLRSLEESP